MPALESLTYLDYAVFAVLALSAILSLLRGGVREALGLACWIGAAYVVFYFYDQARPMVAEMVGHELLTDIATAVGLFLVPLVVFKIIASIIANAVSDGPLGGFDRILGLVFGLARGGLIVTVAWLMAGQFVPADKLPRWAAQAQSKPYLDEGAQWLRQYIPDGFLEETGETATNVLDGAEALRQLQDSQGTGDEGAAGISGQQPASQ